MLDHIIVGQGISGSVLALTLANQNRSLICIDSPSLSSCSKVAAGLFNPIVFKRLAKSWNIDELLPVAKEFYLSAEKTLGKKFFFEQNIIKLFTEEQEIDLWQQKQSKSAGKYLDPNISDIPLAGTKHQGKHAQVIHSGWVDVNAFISAVRYFLQSQKQLIDEPFDHSKLIVEDKLVRYKNLVAQNIIFAEGYKATENPYFPRDAFKLTKGEVLTIKMNGFVADKTVNKGVFILPIGNDLYRVGATYNWKELEESPSTSGFEELKQKLDAVVSIPYEIVDHLAGVRPTIKDRRPVIGSHPRHPNIYFLNGMGTKGVLHAPYCTQHLLNHIITGANIDPELEISRFY